MQLLKLIRTIDSRLAKEACLKTASKLEQDVFLYANDYNKVYHIKQVGDINMAALGEPSVELFNALDFILADTTPMQAKKTTMHDFAHVRGDLIKLIVRKNLDCGATAKTVNKVWPGLVPTFDIQLAKETTLDKVKFPCLAQIKYDGVRIAIIKRNREDPRFFTRSGKEVYLPHMMLELQKIRVDSYMLDSEVTFMTGKMEERTGVSGLINSAMHGGIINEADLRFNVFDTLTVEEWDEHKCYRSYKNRFKHTMFLLTELKSDHYVPAFTIPVEDAGHVNEVYTELLEQGYEGLILKHEDHKYTFKRTKDWVKMKETKTADLICGHCIEGTGKYEGAIGALYCAGTVEGKDITVSVGSGLTDKQRYGNPVMFEGEMIEVKYNAVIQDSVTKAYSLFLPRFSCVRFDK